MTGEQLYNATRCAADYAGVAGFERSWFELDRREWSDWELKAFEQDLRDRELPEGAYNAHSH